MSQAVNRKLSTIEDLILEVRQKIEKLEKELYTIATTVKKFFMASQQIASKEAEMRHLQNQLRSLEESSSSTPPSSSPFMSPKNTLQPIFTPPPTQSFLSNLPMTLQPLPTPSYQSQRAQQPLLLNQHLYDMYSKSYHHVIKPRYATTPVPHPETELPKPRPKPKSVVDPPDPTIGASSKPNILPIDLAETLNPITSFLKNLSITPPIAELIIVCESDSSESDSSLDLLMHGSMEEEHSSLDLLMHGPMEEEPQIDDPMEPPPPNQPNNTQTPPKRVIHDTIDHKTLFSIDDVPPSQWRDQFLQMIAWINAEM